MKQFLLLIFLFFAFKVNGQNQLYIPAIHSGLLAAALSEYLPFAEKLSKN